MPDNPKREPVNVVAIIPARGGTQSVPYKNLQKLGDKTLLAWAIEVAFAAEKIDAVIVSTEDDKTRAEAESLGALVAPRPAEYSQPTSGDAGFYQHTVKWMEEEKGWTPEFLVNLRPTSPLRFAADIDRMVAYIQESGADGVKSVIPAPLHPYKMWQFSTHEARDTKNETTPAIGAAGALVPVFDNDFRQKHGPDQPRQKIQELFPVFFQDGQIDITRRQFVLRPDALELENVWGKDIHGYVLDPRTSTDLDDERDFIRAEKIYEELKREQKE
jgi:CMP-N,N'-diacetyllegionaminic acid synthase